MNNPFSVVAQFAKQADPLPSPTYQAAAAGLGDMPYYALSGLGVGAAAAGVKNLWNMLTRTTRPLHAKFPGAVVTDIPVPADTMPARDKDAALNPLVQALSNMSFGKVVDKANFPWYTPGSLAMEGLGAVAGWKGVDGLADMQRHSQQDHELQKAKQDFEQAMLSSNPQSPQFKVAEASAGSQLGLLLDRIWEKAAASQPDAIPEKVAASWWEGLKDTLGPYADTAAGTYGYYALPAAVMGAYGGYSLAEKGSRRAVLQKALDRRLRASYQAQPSAIYAVPRPVPSAPEEPMATQDSAG
jgi:hypothetical protein